MAAVTEGLRKVPARPEAGIEIGGTTISHITRQKHAEERLGIALRQLNDAIRDVHKSGLDVNISTLTMHTPRGPLIQVDLNTFCASGAPPVLQLVNG